jgi:thiol-disulfide isomerase/thioredoxin
MLAVAVCVPWAVAGAAWAQGSPGATPAGAALRPAWLDLPLTDVATGETFTLGGFAGRTVYVEAMATWCTNCRRLLQSVKEAMARADEDAYVFVGISVESNLPDETLAEYARRWNFPLKFAVATPELVAALVANYGRDVTVPPSTPHFLVRFDGTVTGLNLGFKSPDEILKYVWLGSDMTSAAPTAGPWLDLDQIY